MTRLFKSSYINGTIGHLVWYFVRNGLKIPPKKLKKRNFARINLSLTASCTLKKLFEEGCLLFSNLSKYLPILVILSQISINLSATTVSSTQRVAQKNSGNLSSPATDIKSSLPFELERHVELYMLL